MVNKFDRRIETLMHELYLISRGNLELYDDLQAWFKRNFEEFHIDRMTHEYDLDNASNPESYRKFIKDKMAADLSIWSVRDYLGIEDDVTHPELGRLTQSTVTRLSFVGLRREPKDD